LSYSYKMKSNHVCGDCASYLICCKTFVKNVEETTDSCQWSEDYYYKKEDKNE
jgi:hypothetical protein